MNTRASPRTGMGEAAWPLSGSSPTRQEEQGVPEGTEAGATGPGHGCGEGREALTGLGAWAAAGTSPGAAAGAPRRSASCKEDRPAPSRLRSGPHCLELGADRSGGPGRGRLGGRGRGAQPGGSPAATPPTAPPEGPRVPPPHGLDSSLCGVTGRRLQKPSPAPAPLCPERWQGDPGSGLQAGWAPVSREDLSQGRPRGAGRPSGELPALGSPDRSPLSHSEWGAR